MARITVEDGLKNVPNEFELVMLGAKRAQQLIRGAAPLVKSDNRAVVLALREIEAGKVRKASKENGWCVSCARRRQSRGCLRYSGLRLTLPGPSARKGFPKARCGPPRFRRGGPDLYQVAFPPFQQTIPWPDNER